MTAAVLFDRLLIEVEEFEQTAGGIYVSGTDEKDKVINAKILTIGGQVSAGIKPGMRIIVGRYAGTEIDNSYVNKIGTDEESAKLKKKVISERDILIILRD